MATLTNPGTLTADSLNTFTAPAGTTLAASTTYWITVNEGISSNRAQFALTIQMTRPARRAGQSATAAYGEVTKRKTGTTHSSSLLITIKGTAIPTISLVSNTHLRSVLNQSSSTISAQKFETGANLDGYTVSEVDIALTHVAGRSTSVKIRENNATIEPGNLVATLTNPASLTADSLNTFTAPPGTTLAANKTYWLTMGEGISTNRAQVETDPEMTRPANLTGVSATAAYGNLPRMLTGKPTTLPC